MFEMCPSGIESAGATDCESDPLTTVLQRHPFKIRIYGGLKFELA